MNQRGRTLLGVLFIIAGGLVALDVLNILPGGTSAIWAAIFLVAGLGFLYFFFQDKVRQGTILVDECFETVSNHFFGDFSHPRKIHQRTK